KCLEVKFDINPNGPIPLTLIKSDLKIGETTGRLFFDREAGRVVIDEQSHQVKGEFTIKANDQELPAVLDLRLITNSRE
ncbi:MAG: hypothetical protein ACKVT0_07825, partial [Planctomycetaceae bacterium]